MRVLIMLCVVLLTGCGSTSSSYNTPNEVTGEISRVLVVALTAIPENRTTAEKETVYWLRKNKYQAVASVDFLKAEKRLPRVDEIDKILKDQNLNGLITLRLKEVDEKSRYVTTNEASSTTINAGYYYNYMNAWNANYVPGNYKKASSINVESNVYEVSTAKLVFTTTSETLESQNIEYTISDVAQKAVSKIKGAKILTTRK